MEFPRFGGHAGLVVDAQADSSGAVASAHTLLEQYGGMRDAEVQRRLASILHGLAFVQLTHGDEAGAADTLKVITDRWATTDDPDLHAQTAFARARGALLDALTLRDIEIDAISARSEPWALGPNTVSMPWLAVERLHVLA